MWLFFFMYTNSIHFSGCSTVRLAHPDWNREGRGAVYPDFYRGIPLPRLEKQPLTVKCMWLFFLHKLLYPTVSSVEEGGLSC